MQPSSAFRSVALLVLVAAVPARAWDELGPLAEARRTHPVFFAKGAVHRTEVDGEVYWVFTGDSDQRDGFASLSDTERYAEAALDARRNLLRHVTGGARNVTAEVSGIVVAYRFADGPARRVVCLVPVEKVRVVSASTPAVPAAPAPSTPAAEEPPQAPSAPPAIESPAVPAEDHAPEAAAPSIVSATASAPAPVDSTPVEAASVPAGPPPETASAPAPAPTTPVEAPPAPAPATSPPERAPSPADTGLPRFFPPDLPTPVIP